MRPFFFVLALVLSTGLFAQSPTTNLIGAWGSTFTDGEGRGSQLTMTITDGFMVMTAFNKESGEFIATLGGRWRADGDNFSITYEFNFSDSTQVGRVSTMPYSLIGSVLVFNGDKVWTRTDDMSPGTLPGAWEIIGRKRNGKMQDLSERRNSPRKTMKILSGSRFQWIAFDIDKKQFMATGGGAYTTDENGMYIEKIEFFSRDPERSGSQLSFDYKLQNGDWVHRGFSSKGEPLHEVWSLRK
jgi:hypothetical protein